MEDFVSFELAKKLREKGFYLKEPFAMYNELGVFHKLYSSAEFTSSYDVCFRDYYCYDDFDERDFVAPTISQVLKWLREVKGIDVLPQRGHINLDNNGKVTRYYNVNIYFERRFACTLDNDEQDYSTYEQATIAGIEYVIDNLI